MIDQRINYRYGGGADMGTVSASSNTRPSAPPGGGATSLGSGRDYSPPPTSVSPPTGGDGGGTIIMENIGAPDLGSSIDPVLGFGGYAEFGPVTYKKAPTVFDLISYDKSLDNNRQLYSADQTVSGDLTGREIRKAREDFVTSVGEGRLQNLYEEGVPTIKLPGILGTALNLLKPIRDIGLRKNIDYFKGLSQTQYPQTYQGYKDYIKARMSGEIDAAGNPLPQSDGDSNPLQNLLLAQQLANSTVDQKENLQGGVAQLYNQYLQNLGSL